MRIILKKDNYNEFVEMLINGELLIYKRLISVGTLYPRILTRYPFFINDVEYEVKTSQCKDRLLLYARRNNLIFDEGKGHVLGVQLLVV